MNFLSLAHKAIKATQNTPQRATLYLYRFLLLTCRPDVFACIALGQHQGSMTVIKKKIRKKGLFQTEFNFATAASKLLPKS